jgi:CIC family chloride channel protein
VKSNPLTVPVTAGFAEIVEKFIATRFNYLYVTEDDRFVGAISLHDIKNYLHAPELAEVVIAGDIVRESFPLVPEGANLIEALERFQQHDGERLPVVKGLNDRRLVGSIAKTDLILALAGSSRQPVALAGAPAGQ